MKSSLKFALTRVAAAAALTACTTWSANAQTAPAFIAPGPVAPKMLSEATDKERKWANADNFGTIPARLRADAARECTGMGDQYKPAGYHPDALDRNGKLITGGGFLCLTQETIDQVSKAQKK